MECPYKEICRDYHRIEMILKITKDDWLSIPKISELTHIPYNTVWRIMKRVEELNIFDIKNIIVYKSLKFGQGSAKGCKGYRNRRYLNG